MNKVINFIDQIAHGLFALGLILVLFITSIDYHCFDYNFFKNEYQKLNTAESLGMSQDDLMSATTTLLDYLKEERDDIKVMVTLSGNQMEAFNTKESAHMIDVRALYQNALMVRNIALIVSVISLIYLIVKQRKGMILGFCSNYIKVAILFGFAIALLAIWAIADFDAFWTCFHEVLFTNDLWLLDPRVDLMINLFPADFFFALVMRIVITFLVMFLGIFSGCIIYLKMKLKKGSA